MKVVLATGIYPPAIGGPATYVQELGKRLQASGCDVSVVTYGDGVPVPDALPVIRVSKRGGPLLRWRRFARALRSAAHGADIVYTFSSVSCGMPLLLSRLRDPRTILRLGGDFLWERATDRGSRLGLREWYEGNPWFQETMNGILRTFDHIVFSTEFQRDLYERFYRRLPSHSVIENALPGGQPILHRCRVPLRLLFLGRFVAFKNLPSLLSALVDLPDMTLSLVGEGPLEQGLRVHVQELGLADRVAFHPPVTGREKHSVLLEHDLLVLPSLTEISPNAALEARAAGLPVLLTEETGLSRQLTDGAMLRRLRTPADIVVALREARDQYEQLATRAASPLPQRHWETVCEEHLTLFRSLL